MTQSRSPLSRDELLALFFLLAALILCRPAFAVADPLSDEITARPLALGGAYTALSNDGSALFFNPAGLAFIKQPNFVSLYSQPLSNTKVTVLAGTAPKYFGGNIGVGYRNSTISNVPVSSETSDYTNQDITLAYTRKVGRLLSLGGSVRFLSRFLSNTPASYEGLNGGAVMFDAGIKWQNRPWLETGIILRSVGGKIIYQDGYTEEIAAQAAAGVLLKLLGRESYLKEEGRGDLYLVFDISKNLQQPLAQAHLGLEWQPAEIFSARLGLNQAPKSAAENNNDLTAGFGLLFSGVTFDYAYKMWSDVNRSPTHYFSLGYVGRKAPPPRKLEAMHFFDVPADYWARKPIEYLTAMGILDHYPDQTFRPERAVSRAEIIAVLARLKALPPPREKKMVFSDVPIDYWAADYIQSAWERKIALGYPDGTFQPRRPTSRVENTVFVARAEGLTSEAKLKAKPFADVSLEHWGIAEVLRAKEEGLLAYLENRRFQPAQGLTRAELAEVLFRTRLVKQELEKYWTGD